MSFQSQVEYPNMPAATGRQVAQLRQMLGLVEQIAGRAPTIDLDALDDSARLSSAYADASPMAQRRFDAIADEAACWSAAGVEALVAAARDGRPPKAAARRLANELVRALADLGAVLRD